MALSADESFGTLAESITYATARGWTDWLAADDATREAKLREATGFIVATTRWPGTLADTAQVLPFPRVGLYDIDRRYIDGTPDALKAAEFEAARLALTGPLVGGSQGSAKAGIKSVRAGPVAVEFTGTATDTRRDQLAYVRALLRSTGALIAGVNAPLLKA